ncbi:Conserved hypothetical protein, putative porin [Herminiimonas arsenicoxydans]|uniref:Transporter n=1 Tax=Herminiimonas arsenicoxydans TaxID=204773 RepID=A4G3R9_HERAR|nr:Conserved hypothetical protein, putative porin [Herminiimonas arsenicoxydans]
MKLLRGSVPAALSVCCASTWAMHPMVTDDTATQGRQRSQIEINTDWVRGRGYDGRIADFTYTYGLSDSVDIALDMPSNLSSPAGLNDVAIGFKWRFAEMDGISFAVTPTLALSTGSEQRGLSNGTYNPGAALIGSYATGSWVWLANVGIVSNRYRQNELRAANRAIIRRASLAVTYAIDPQWTVVADTGIAQNMRRSEQGNPAYFLFGAVYSPNQTIDLDAGIKFGLKNVGPSRQVGVGLTVHF